jgi:hypothetical protein
MGNVIGLPQGILTLACEPGSLAVPAAPRPAWLQWLQLSLASNTKTYLIRCQALGMRVNLMHFGLLYVCANLHGN